MTSQGAATEETVRPVVEVGPLFETIALDGTAGSRNLGGEAGTAVTDDGLPFGKTVLVEGIPMQFGERSGSEDADHIDIGQSMSGQANFDR